MVLAEHCPTFLMFELHRQFRILMLDQFFPRVASVNADQTVEHQLEVAGQTIPVHRADDRPRIREVQSSIISVPLKFE